jgi:hypothetical protein
MVYFEELFLYALRATVRLEFGTTENASGPGYMGMLLGEESLFFEDKTYQIKDLTKVNLHTTIIEVRVVG